MKRAKAEADWDVLGRMCDMTTGMSIDTLLRCVAEGLSELTAQEQAVTRLRLADLMDEYRKPKPKRTRKAGR